MKTNIEALEEHINRYYGGMNKVKAILPWSENTVDVIFKNKEKIHFTRKVNTNGKISFNKKVLKSTKNPFRELIKDATELYDDEFDLDWQYKAAKKQIKTSGATKEQIITGLRLLDKKYKEHKKEFNNEEEF